MPLKTIYIDQPPPAEIPTQRPVLMLYSWWKLPSGQVVELRKISGEHNPEVVVRNVNSDGEMAQGEYNLSLRFLVTRAKRVEVTR
ncbi:hypothetical protein [Pseudacidovorax intermedius]|uniref:hypothetical protein n=1 Tax=Pseudacidovorax intermedius TaxID=433924 RepID=UPI000347759F|nr:hypothetical protein [Pseudacidovorax intermedius]